MATPPCALLPGEAPLPLAPVLHVSCMRTGANGEGARVLLVGAAAIGGRGGGDAPAAAADAASAGGYGARLLGLHLSPPASSSFFPPPNPRLRIVSRAAHRGAAVIRRSSRALEASCALAAAHGVLFGEWATVSGSVRPWVVGETPSCRHFWILPHAPVVRARCLSMRTPRPAASTSGC